MKSSLSPDPAFLRLAHVSVFKLIVLALHLHFFFKIFVSRFLWLLCPVAAAHPHVLHPCWKLR